MYQILKNTDFLNHEDIGLAIDRQESQPPCPPHKHEFCEIVIIKSGTGLHVIGRQEYPITAGDVFVVMGNSVHAYKNLNNLNLVNILYDASRLGMGNWDMRSLPGYHAMFKLEPAFRRQHKFESRLKLAQDSLTHALELCAKLDSELKTRKGGFQIMAESVFKELVVFLSRSYSSLPHTRSGSLLRMAKAISHIEESFQSEIDVDKLAGIAHMSRRNFQRVFNMAVGMSPVNYLVHIRLMHAAELLKWQDTPITQIAFTSGFKDSNYFSRQFRKKFGHSPRQFRSLSDSRTGLV